MTRYAILEHRQGNQVHWDFFLQRGAVLQAWRLEEPPQPNTTMQCSSAPDHRLVYLDYEGPLSGDRGHVKRWDWGEYRLELDTPTAIAITVTGHRLLGSLELERDTPGETQWRLTYHATST